MLLTSGWKSASRTKWYHFGSPGQIPIWFNHHSIALVLLYNNYVTGTKFFHQVVPKLHTVEYWCKNTYISTHTSCIQSTKRHHQSQYYILDILVSHVGLPRHQWSFLKGQIRFLQGFFGLLNLSCLLLLPGLHCFPGVSQKMQHRSGLRERERFNLNLYSHYPSYNSPIKNMTHRSSLRLMGISITFLEEVEYDTHLRYNHMTLVCI